MAGAARFAVALTGLLAWVATACTLVYSRGDYDGARSDGGGATDADDGDAPGGDAGSCIFHFAVHHVHNPTTSADIFTLTESEVTNSALAGYTEDRGTAFRAATLAGPARAPAYRIYNPKTSDRIWTLSSSETQNAVANGYTGNEGIGFYAGTSPGPCVVPVHGLERLGRHVLTASDEEHASLIDAGWHEEGIRFYGGVP